MAERESYKGIEFVRISNLPVEQIEHLYTSFPKEKIIKILKGDVILKDCIQYQEYQEWVKQSYRVIAHPAKPLRGNTIQLTHK